MRKLRHQEVKELVKVTQRANGKAGIQNWTVFGACGLGHEAF